MSYSKPRKTYTTIVGILLEKIAAAQPPTPAGIKVIRGGNVERRVTPAVALELVRSGSYIGKVSPKGRLLHITEVDRRVFVVDFAFWNDRAVIRFTTDLRAIPERIKRRESVLLWDRLLMQDPAPRLWGVS